MPTINSPTPDATTGSKGKIQLAGALSGTAASPSIAPNTTISTPIIDQINASGAPGVKITARTQTDNANTIASATTAGLIVQYGWGQINGNGTANITDTVTFPTAFTTLLGVMVSTGGNSIGTAANISGLTGAIPSTFSDTGWYNATNTGFTAQQIRSTGTFVAGNYYGYSWVAWGV